MEQNGMEQIRYCQSCGMPLGDIDDLLGTNADGTKNQDYCIYCYKGGAFIADITMEQMIDFCVPHMVAASQGMSEEEAKKMMQEIYPHLKRWQAQ